MSLEFILATVIATNVIMWIRIYMLKRRLDGTDMMLHAVMEEGAPKMYRDYKAWEERRCSDK